MGAHYGVTEVPQGSSVILEGSFRDHSRPIFFSMRRRHYVEKKIGSPGGPKGGQGLIEAASITTLEKDQPIEAASIVTRDPHGPPGTFQRPPCICSSMHFWDTFCSLPHARTEPNSPTSAIESWSFLKNY